MTIVHDSRLVRWLMAFWAALGRWAAESAAAGVLRRAGSALGTAAEGSGVCRFFRREGAPDRAWRDSLSCRVLSRLLNLPCALLRRLGLALGGKAEGSALLRLCAAENAPAVLLGLFVLVLLVAPHQLWNNVYGLLGALAVTALFILGAALRPARRLDAAALGPYMLFYGMCICGGLVFSQAVGLSVRFFLFHLCAFLTVLMAVSSVTRYRQLRLYVAVAAAGMAFAALYGCYQGVVGVEVVAVEWDPVLNSSMTGRVYSFFDNANNFAQLLVMFIPLIAVLLTQAKGWRARVGCAAALALCLAALGLTYSRSGFIGLAVAALVFVALTNWKLIPVLLILGLAALPLLPASIYARILTIGDMTDTSTVYRLAIYERAFALLRDYWRQGVGLGTDVLRQVFRSGYAPMNDGMYPLHAHNNYVQLWCELGITGLLAFLALLFSGLKNGVKALRRTENKALRHMCAAAVSAFCGILVISLAEYTWYYPRNLFLYWFLFGIILACVKLGKQEQAAAPAASL